MSTPYWAVRPTSMPDQIRIEQAENGFRALELAFGRNSLPGTRLAAYDVGKWQVKNMGTRRAVLQSDKKRIALLKDPSGWVDPYVT